MHATLRVLRREPRFHRLLAAGFISGIGDWFNSVAVLSLLLSLTGSGFAVGAGLALRVLPRLAVGPVGGTLADRLPRKAILIATDLASAAFALSFLLVTGPDRLWVVYAGTVLLVVSSILHAPARVAAVPGLVAEENLLAANALQGSVDGSVMVVGSVVGGLAAAAFGVRVAFILNAASFLASALLTAPIRFPAPKARAARGMAALGELWTVVRRSRLLRVILLMQVLWPLGGGAVNVLLSVYGFRVFGAGDAGVGVLYGAVGVGLLLGGLLTHRFARHVRRAAIAGFVAEGLCHALVSRSPSLAVAAGFVATATVAAGVGNACTMYLVMRTVPPHVLGRFSALGGTLSGATFAGSMFLAGLLLAAVPPRTLGLAAGLLIAALGVLCGAFLLRADGAPAEGGGNSRCRGDGRIMSGTSCATRCRTGRLAWARPGVAGGPAADRAARCRSRREPGRRQREARASGSARRGRRAARGEGVGQREARAFRRGSGRHKRPSQIDSRAARYLYWPRSPRSAGPGWAARRRDLMRGDDMPPRQPQRRGLLSGAPQAGRTLAPRGYGRGPDDPFAPYQAYGGGPRIPGTAGPPPTGTMGRVPAVGSYTSTHVPALKHLRLGISIFHDGNPGHLWRGEFFSRLGESILSVGIVMWVAALTVSPLAVASAVAAFAIPYVLAGPLAARFENAGHPALLLKWIGRLRAVLAFSLVVLHFRTIFPLLFAVLLALSFLGRIRDALRVATIRTCLAPGEPEHVANDLHIGFSFAAVAGPLLATLLFILNGERILLLSLGAVACFALCANSETFLDALPEKRRAFLLAVPDNDDEPDEEDDDEEATPHPPSPQERREHALAEWYQQGPTRPVEAVADLRAGFGLAGSSAVSTVALWATCALALIGGGLATLEVFYVLYRVQLPAYYLGPLVAAEGAGLVLGIHLASLIMPRLWRVALFGGIAGAGAALVLMTWTPRMPVPLLLALALGVANSLAVAGSRHALTDGFDGIERRALSAAEAWLAALCGVAGAVLLPLFYSGSFVLPHGQTARLPFRTYPIEQLLPMMGLALAASAVLFAALLTVLGRRRSPSEDDDVPTLSGTRARLASLAGKKGGEAGAGGDDDAWGETGASEALEAWGDEGEDGGDWDDDRYAASAAYDRDDAGWGDTGYQDAAYQDDYDDPRGRSHSRAPRGGSSARNRRERW